MESEQAIMVFRIWGLAQVQLALAAAGFVEISRSADHQPAQRPGRNSRILNLEARRPAS